MIKPDLEASYVRMLAIPLLVHLLLSRCECFWLDVTLVLWQVTLTPEIGWCASSVIPGRIGKCHLSLCLF